MRLNLVLLCLLLSAHTVIRAAEVPGTAAPGDLHSWCRTVTSAIPQVKLNTCVAAELKPWAKSVKGRPIMVREFPAPQTAPPRVLVVGGIHGDELPSVEIVFRWIELLKQPTADARRY